MVGLLALLLFSGSGLAAFVRRTTTVCRDREAKVTIDEYRAGDLAEDGSAVVFLYGSGGLQSSALRYSREARFFASAGRRVYVPHYLDVTHGRARDPESHYDIWARAVEDFLSCIQSRTGITSNRVVLVGYSLGGSVALSVAASHLDLAGVVVWSGSLPDAYRDVKSLPSLLILHGGRDPIVPGFNALQLAELCRIRQFRCKLNMYPEEGHAFSAKGIAGANRQIRTFLDSVLRPH